MNGAPYRTVNSRAATRHDLRYRCDRGSRAQRSSSWM